MKSKILIPERIFFRIGDVAEILAVKPYVIRFWEGEFPFVAPEKSATGQRVYRRTQIECLILVKHLLHVERYSIEGAKKKLTELRKQAKLKETILELLQDGEIKIGDTLPKAQVLSLKEKINELQTLIRKPETMGHEVPKLLKE